MTLYGEGTENAACIGNDNNATPDRTTDRKLESWEPIAQSLECGRVETPVLSSKGFGLSQAFRRLPPPSLVRLETLEPKGTEPWLVERQQPLGAYSRYFSSRFCAIRLRSYGLDRKFGRRHHMQGTHESTFSTFPTHSTHPSRRPQQRRRNRPTHPRQNPVVPQRRLHRSSPSPP